MALTIFSLGGVPYLLVFLLVFSLVYAVLSRIRFFDRKDIIAIIAVSVALMSLASSFFVTYVVVFLPYVLIIVLFIFLVLLILETATVPGQSISAYLGKSVIIPAVVLLLLFIFAIVAYSFTQQTLGATSSGGSSSGGSSGGSSSSGSGTAPSLLNGGANLSYIVLLLTSPSVLSLLITLLAMGVAVYFMTREHGA